MVVDINTKLKDYMDQDKINLKYFIIITSILNTLIGYLLIKSIVEYREATNSYNYLDSSKSELNQILNKPEYKNLKESDVRYQNYIEKMIFPSLIL